ncbi:fidgetin protein [Loa loa]|uniref:Fidgetin protein n=1 Tax=Loa loa TaxID=7209 RepID=A0A1I7VQE1_LOALO|nr:fidgetin protein [Loa loa]EFO22555.2 fidgetin protein [Loa loa]
MNRKRANSDGDGPSTDLDQMKPETTKEGRFNFTQDPKVLEVQRQLLDNMNNPPSINQDDVKHPCSTNSNKNVGSIKYYRLIKRNGVCSRSGFDTDFKSASGRPVVKKVMPVFPDNVNTINDKTQRYLGGRKVVLTNEMLVHKMDTNGNVNELQNRHPAMNSGCGVVSKREGWKADESLKNLDDNIINIIEAEIMSTRTDIQWADVSGLESAKKALKEVIVLPFLRPDIFKGIRAPPKGVLLFGPPGTGKTMIGRCVASQCKATFFNIAASSITSKWVGEGEKLVRALFAIARVLQPSVVFIDEIDSLLTSRNESEHESSRRIKTEFLIHLDGVATSSDERILILGATNRPQELDSAVKRRFAKRLYIGLPCDTARVQMIQSLLSDQKHDLSDDDIQSIAKLTNGYSGADMKQLCCEAAMVPVRNIVDSSSLDIASISADDIRSISFSDFETAMRFVRPTVVEKDLEGYQTWNKQYGSFVPD